MHGQAQAKIEASIARAHRNLTVARDEASTLADLGLHDDLCLHLLELERLQRLLLKDFKLPKGYCSHIRVSQTDTLA